MRRILSVICAICLLTTQLCVFSDAASVDENFRKKQLLSIVQSYAELDGKEAEVGTPIPLYNLSDTIEAYCYPIIPKGYVIISYKTGKIIECSRTAECPINAPVVSVNSSTSEPRYYYNGVLQYYEREKDLYIHTGTQEVYSANELSEILNERYVENIQISQAPIASVTDSSDCLSVPTT